MQVADDGAVGVAFLVQPVDQGLCLIRRDRSQQAAAGLRIKQKAGARAVGDI